MLTIVDLHQNEELSASDMGKVGGGACDDSMGRAASGMAEVFVSMGMDKAAIIMTQTANAAYGTCLYNPR
jgi:hypothetical protein